MKLASFDFDLPPALIAQHPVDKRTESRLLVANKSSIIDTKFEQILNFISPNDLLIMNNTKVIPARLFAHKESGGKIEIIIERIISENQALAMIRASKAPKVNSFITLTDGTKVLITAREDNFYNLQFTTKSLSDLLNKTGNIPLPPYIKRASNADDLERYQTVYAQHKGAVAAPTAGLHFDEELLSKLKSNNINYDFVTLHVGAGTFAPVRVDNIKEHKMHSERFSISAAVIAKIIQTKKNGGRIIAVGTTVVRTLEHIAQQGDLTATNAQTDIFIYPGFQFKLVDALITNFHTPKSSLLMLVSAFVGRDRIFEIYQHAIAEKYRFFSYGDAMILERLQQNN